MTHNQPFNQPQPTFQSGIPQNPGAVFQPGFANTNAQEVQYLNQSGYAQPSPAPTYGFTQAGAFGGGQAMFQPGFAGTNAQEVRQNNSVLPQQPQSGGFSPFHQPSYQSAFPGQAGSIYSPGFAGTNVQEVQARNNSGYNSLVSLSSFAGTSGYPQQNQAVNSIFSPQFAGTNSQEVRQQNQTGYSSTPQQQGYAQQFQQQAYHPQQQQMQSFASPQGVQSVFTPGFAGTNAQEVRSQNAGPSAPHPGSIFPGSF